MAQSSCRLGSNSVDYPIKNRTQKKTLFYPSSNLENPLYRIGEIKKGHNADLSTDQKMIIAISKSPTDICLNIISFSVPWLAVGLSPGLLFQDQKFTEG